jgi:hypothetical protein
MTMGEDFRKRMKRVSNNHAAIKAIIDGRKGNTQKDVDSITGHAMVVFFHSMAEAVGVPSALGSMAKAEKVIKELRKEWLDQKPKDDQS